MTVPRKKQNINNNIIATGPHSNQPKLFGITVLKSTLLSLNIPNDIIIILPNMPQIQIWILKDIFLIITKI
jgi:hypothetical protein